MITRDRHTDLLMFIQAINEREQSRHPWQAAPGHTKTCPAAMPSYLSKIKLCSDYYFKNTWHPPARGRDQRDNATIKYINNSFRTASIDSQKRVSNALLLGINKWSRCMACCSYRRMIAPIAS